MKRILTIATVLGVVLSFLSGASAAPKTADSRCPHWYTDCDLPPIPIPVRDAKDTSILALKKTDVQVRVLGPFAEVEVIQYYQNPADVPITVGYTFPLPGDAAFRDLEVVIGDRVLRADLREKEEARRIYQDAASAGHGAVLVEAQRENMYRAQIANVLPHQSLGVRLRYSQRISFENNSYRLTFPTVVAPRYCPTTLSDSRLFDLPYVPSGMPGHSIAIRVDVNAGAAVTNIASSSHAISVSGGAITHVELGKKNEVPNRDFILTWRVPDNALATSLWTGARQEGGTPFLFVAYPPRQVVTKPSPRELIFILDSSGSMSGDKFDAARRAVRGLLRGLSGQDSFRLVEFDDKFSTLSDRSLEFGQNALDKADAWLDRIEADGGTEILAAIKYALELKPAANREKIIVLLTDGQVGNEEEVLAAVKKEIGKARLFTLGIDYAVNDEMLKAMARVGRGSCILTTPDEDVEGAVLSLKNRFTDPVLTDIALGLKGAELFPDPLPDLFSGEPLVVLGRFAGAQPTAVTVTGKQEGKPWSTEVTVVQESADGVNLDAIVAEKEIESILDNGRNSDPEKVKAEVIARSLKHRVATLFTAFVVVEKRDVVTDTGIVRNVEVPVAFPYGWNWNTVFGEAEACYDASIMPACKSLGRGGMFYAAAPAPMMARQSTRPAGAATTTVVSPETLSRRFLARSQRANGLWQISGKDNLQVTALATLGLLADYGTYRSECDRALGALAAAQPGGADVTTKALVRLALEQGAQLTGDATLTRAAQAWAGPAIGLTDKDWSTCPQSNQLADLTLLAAGLRSLSDPATREAERSAAVARLAALVESAGTNAGSLKLGSGDPLAATAVFAALAQ